mmetsp:Transcript_13822/g.54634  ORF Transcript_13822/g.54634 Transcript_13822/m.54634 type:complete len:338 (-) Transcript_13822:754-1767(-)
MPCSAEGSEKVTGVSASMPPPWPTPERSIFPSMVRKGLASHWKMSSTCGSARLKPLQYSSSTASAAALRCGGRRAIAMALVMPTASSLVMDSGGNASKSTACQARTLERYWISGSLRSTWRKAASSGCLTAFSSSAAKASLKLAKVASSRNLHCSSSSGGCQSPSCSGGGSSQRRAQTAGPMAAWMAEATPPDWRKEASDSRRERSPPLAKSGPTFARKCSSQRLRAWWLTRLPCDQSWLCCDMVSSVRWRERARSALPMRSVSFSTRQFSRRRSSTTALHARKVMFRCTSCAIMLCSTSVCAVTKLMCIAKWRRKRITRMAVPSLRMVSSQALAIQ